jgi:hypothetical protein
MEIEGGSIHKRSSLPGGFDGKLIEPSGEFLIDGEKLAGEKCDTLHGGAEITYGSSSYWFWPNRVNSAHHPFQKSQRG